MRPIKTRDEAVNEVCRLCVIMLELRSHGIFGAALDYQQRIREIARDWELDQKLAS